MPKPKPFDNIRWKRVPPVLDMWPPLPLKVGIFDDLVPFLDGSSESELREALRWHTSTEPYLTAVLNSELGASRYDVEGKPCQEVTYRQLEFAMLQLGRLYERQKTRAGHPSSVRNQPVGPNASRPVLSLKKG